MVAISRGFCGVYCLCGPGRVSEVGLALGIGMMGVGEVIVGGVGVY